MSPVDLVALVAMGLGVRRGESLQIAARRCLSQSPAPQLRVRIAAHAVLVGDDGVHWPAVERAAIWLTLPTMTIVGDRWRPSRPRGPIGT